MVFTDPGDSKRNPRVTSTRCVPLRCFYQKERMTFTTRVTPQQILIDWVRKARVRILWTIINVYAVRLFVRILMYYDRSLNTNWNICDGYDWYYKNNTGVEQPYAKPVISSVVSLEIISGLYPNVIILYYYYYCSARFSSRDFTAIAHHSRMHYSDMVQHGWT
jgi:hypothetical protein